MSERQVKLVIDSRLEDVFFIGLAVKRFCEYVRLTDLECYQIEICVVEAVTNSIKHAYGGEAGHEVEVVVTLRSAAIEVDVCDTGRVMSEDIWQSVGEQADERDFHELNEGGRGAYILSNLMDEVEYATAQGRNTLRMLKSLTATAR